MTSNRDERRVSLVEKREQSSEGRAGLAAARASHRVAGLLNRAKEAASLRSSDIARALGISEGRVSQVMNGDGNFHVATIARFLSAMGYELELSASPRDEGSTLPVMTAARAPRRVAERQRRNWNFSEQVYARNAHATTQLGLIERMAAVYEPHSFWGPSAGTLMVVVPSRHHGVDFHWSTHGIDYRSESEIDDWPERTDEALHFNEEMFS